MKKVIVRSRCGSRLIACEYSIILDALRHYEIVVYYSIGVLRVSLSLLEELLSILTAPLHERWPVTGELCGIMLHLLEPYAHVIGSLLKRTEGKELVYKLLVVETVGLLRVIFHIESHELMI